MAPELTAGAWLKLYNQEPQPAEDSRLRLVVQVTDIWSVVRQIPNTNDNSYDLMLSDSSYSHLARLDRLCNGLVTTSRLQKGSIVQLTYFVCRWFSDRMTLTINNLNMILDKADIIGDPKPFDYGVFQSKKAHAGYSDVDQETLEHSCPFQVPTTNQKQISESSIDPDNKFVVAEQDISNINARIISSMMEKNKEDDRDMDACIEKLDKLGWETQDPLLYDTALLLFGESGVYRKLWLHLLKLESCDKWVRNVGSKYELLG